MGSVASLRRSKTTLPSEVRIRAFFESEPDVRKTVERNGTHDLEVRRAVHGELEGKSGEALDFFGGVAGPLGDELDHGRRKIGIGVDGHAAEGFGAGDDDQERDHQDEEALAQGELDNVMDHREFFRPRLPLVLQRILELQKQAAVTDDVLAFLQATR